MGLLSRIVTCSPWCVAAALDRSRSSRRDRHAHAEHCRPPCRRPSPSRSRSTRRLRAASTGPSRSSASKGADRRDSRDAGVHWDRTLRRRGELRSRQRPRAACRDRCEDGIRRATVPRASARFRPARIRSRAVHCARRRDASIRHSPPGLPRPPAESVPGRAVARRREPSAGSGLPLRESFAAGRLPSRGSPSRARGAGGAVARRTRGMGRLRARWPRVRPGPVPPLPPHAACGARSGSARAWRATRASWRLPPLRDAW